MGRSLASHARTYIVVTAGHDLAHLARRFAGAITARPLRSHEQDFVHNVLSENEDALWQRMSVADQRHAYGVARRVQQALGSDATKSVLAAALLHDIGKIESSLGTIGRSLATIAANLGVRSARVRNYRAHNEIGRQLLQRAGSDELVCTWAFEHERPKHEWTIDPSLASALHLADDD